MFQRTKVVEYNSITSKIAVYKNHTTYEVAYTPTEEWDEQGYKVIKYTLSEAMDVFHDLITTDQGFNS